ncbi:MAG TPA: PAS domain S-box protein, partial [Thermoanaerobaculia bacterium]|nr:PAS domain S-box protein [Thermoanaerobaculia bacterium]
DAFVTLLAYPSREELLMQQASTVYRSPEHRRKIMDALRACGRVEDKELQLLRADGTPIWTRISSHLITENDRQLVQTYVMPIDDFKEATERYAEIVETIRAVSWRADRETLRFTEVAPEAERLLGFPLERWYEEGFWESRIHPDDREWAVAFCRATAAANRSHQFEYRMIAADGHVVWVRDMVRVSGTELSGVLADITIEKAADERLRASEERFRSLVAGAREIIYTLTPDGILTSLNPAFEAVTGWTAADWTGRHALALVHPEDQEPLRQRLRDRVDDSSMRQFEVRVRAADGTYRTIEVWGAGRRDRNGVVVERFGFANDITELRALERTIEQLEQATRLAALDRIAATMAHEFRNVLSAAGTARDILLRDASAQNVHNATRILTTCLRRGQSITDDVLRFTRPGEVDRRRVDAATLLRDVAGETNALLYAIALHVIEPPPSLTVEGDPTLLQQALLNIVVNARDATPRGGRIEVGAAVSDDPRRLHIWVRDEGPGIDPDVMPRIFEPMFTTKSKGTGLGLAVTRPSVAMNGGTIDAESEQGHGAT